MRNIVSVRNVSDAGERHRGSEFGTEGRQAGMKSAHHKNLLRADREYTWKRVIHRANKFVSFASSIGGTSTVEVNLGPSNSWWAETSKSSNLGT